MLISLVAIVQHNKLNLSQKLTPWDKTLGDMCVGAWVCCAMHMCMWVHVCCDAYMGDFYVFFYDLFYIYACSYFYHSCVCARAPAHAHAHTYAHACVSNGEWMIPQFLAVERHLLYYAVNCIQLPVYKINSHGVLRNVTEFPTQMALYVITRAHTRTHTQNPWPKKFYRIFYRIFAYNLEFIIWDGFLKMYS